MSRDHSDERTKVEPAPQAKETARDDREGAEDLAGKVKEEVKELAESPTGQKVKEGAKQVGEGLKTGAREAAAATGRGLATKRRTWVQFFCSTWALSSFLYGRPRVN